MTADITKAFLQIRVRRPDQDVHRFLWNVNDSVRVMRFVRVPFGNCSSPFLLNATIKHHLATVPQTQVVQELESNFYVDDWLSGCDSDEDACAMVAKATRVMEGASMSLSKWCSNSGVVADMLSREFHDRHMAVESVKVLGLKWLAQQDCFAFDGLELPGDAVFTKRLILSVISRLFDPLGLLAPFTMLAKCMFQDLWKLGLAWDEVVPDDFQRQIAQWVAGMHVLKSWHVPRSYTGRAWRENAEVCLHAFGDASERGYGACVYVVVRFLDGSVCSSLVTSRARVAPLKKVSLPRLELLAALLCARLLLFVQRTLGFPRDMLYTCWTDSTVVLAWVKADSHRWQTFVANRVAEIQELTNPACWRHCPGRQNPADLLTRGLYAEELVASSLWLAGPEFMRESFDDSQTASCDAVDDESVITEQANPAVSLVTTRDVCDPLFDVSRWGSLGKAIRVVGWVKRFLHNAKCS